MTDILAIAAYTADQVIRPTDTIEATFVLTPFGPIVEID